MLKHVAALASTLALSACSVFGVRSGTEEPRFEALGTEAGLEFRRYAPRLAAETVVPAPEEAARSEGFSRLARYIFGGNQGSARIAMTAPVAQDSMRIAMTAPVAQAATPSGYRIRFFLPAALRDPPAPLDARVTVVEVPAETVAVQRFTGLPSPEAVAEARRRLEAALPATRWVAAGEAVAWFYDPPWTIPALRRNEVAVPVVPR
ncbi:SOUL family heme-binding protein [Falsiroseomonas stagni]|uniref:SOUL heme-binding protein n=1 Tax=Falsiroseomonas stagni DSM 19981 TaxID=1123062 RepID=A0A1I3ZFV4_9PROT|nr:heme-binding protein [Falsiroseomonas stagni]SFK42601.1 SOUL heme-binding protein [Falsiroseomonas stagni DSM 19981]